MRRFEILNTLVDVVRVAITHNGNTWTKGERDLRVSGTIRWQACDDHVCHVPRSERFELTVALKGINTQEFQREEGSNRMDFQRHFARMIERRTGGGGGAAGAAQRRHANLGPLRRTARKNPLTGYYDRNKNCLDRT